MTAPPKIEVTGLTKQFGEKQVLKGVDLTVGQAESVVVIGGSGVGKSVAIKCILGLIRPDAGSIKVDGEEVTRLSARDRGATRYLNGLVDSVIRASICSVTRMVPISAAIEAPTRPATIRPVSTGPSSRVIETTTTFGIAASALNRLKPVWLCSASTMPVKIAVRPAGAGTIGYELLTRLSRRLPRAYVGGVA